MQRSYRTRQGKLLFGFLFAGLVSVGPVQAGDIGKVDCSLKFIPADAAFYTTMLRNQEQMDIVANSKAWARLRSMPAVQLGLMAMRSQSNNPQVAPFMQIFQQPENQQLLSLLGEMVSQEIFVYGGESFIGFTELLVQAGNAVQYGPLAELKAGGVQSSGKAQARALLRYLAEHQNLMRMPDLVIGFKLKGTEPAKAQLKRLETHVKDLAQQVPLLQGRFQRASVAGNDFLTLKLDGSMLPLDKIPVQDWEEKEGEFDFVIKRLKEMKLTVSLGLRDNYLLLALGESTAVIEKLGSGGHLTDRPEMKMLDKHADQKLVSTSYLSQALRAKTGTNKKDIARLAEFANTALKGADLTDEQRAKIRKDLAELSRDIEPFIPSIGAAVSCTFLTGQGYEGYSYDWSESPSLDSSKPLTILDHLGGSPLVAIAARLHHSPERMEMARKWLGKLPGYLDEFLVPHLEAEQKEKYQAVTKIAFPLLERLGKTTETMLVPALADGQFAFVLDAKIKSKQWHKAMPASDKDLPMLEPGIVVGVSDAALLRKAFSDYLAIANDAIAKFHELEPEKIPEFHIPAPQTGKLSHGTSYFYPLPPQVELDEHIVPNAALSDHVAALTINQDHSDRLLQNTPLKVETGPLADAQKPMAVAVYVHCEGFIQTLAPWIDYGVREVMRKRGGDDEAAAKRQAEGILSQVRPVLEVLRVFRSYSSSTYLEGKVTVTHHRTVIRDLK